MESGTKFPNVVQISKFQPNLRIVHPISEFLTNFLMLSKFQNFGISTKFHNVDQISADQWLCLHKLQKSFGKQFHFLNIASGKHLKGRFEGTSNFFDPDVGMLSKGSSLQGSTDHPIKV